MFFLFVFFFLLLSRRVKAESFFIATDSLDRKPTMSTSKQAPSTTRLYVAVTFLDDCTTAVTQGRDVFYIDDKETLVSKADLIPNLLVLVYWPDENDWFKAFVHEVRGSFAFLFFSSSWFLTFLLPTHRGNLLAGLKKSYKVEQGGRIVSKELEIQPAGRSSVAKGHPDSPGQEESP